MNTQAERRTDLPGKLIAALLIAAFLALGVIGLVLPIIPGLLFLGLAAALVARHVPAVDRRLRRNRKLRGYLDRSDTFFELGLRRRVQLCGLICIRGLLEAVGLIQSLLGKLPGRPRTRYYR